jgi:acyl-homoserine-lactone acylase
MAAVMTGGTAACDWRGAVAAAQRPRTVRSDYVVNANDSHWWPSLNTFLNGYPKIIATGPAAEGSVQGERTRTGHAIVRDRLNGSDGLAGNRFCVAKLQALNLQVRFMRAEKSLPGFASACQLATNASAEALDACTVLQGRNLKHGFDSSGAVLFREFYQALGELNAASWWSVPFKAADPLETLRGSANTAAALALLETLVAQPQFNTATKRQARPMDVQVLLRNGAPVTISGGRYIFNNWRGQKMLDPLGSRATI